MSLSDPPDERTRKPRRLLGLSSRHLSIGSRNADECCGRSGGLVLGIVFLLLLTYVLTPFYSVVDPVLLSCCGDGASAPGASAWWCQSIMWHQSCLAWFSLRTSVLCSQSLPIKSDTTTVHGSRLNPSCRERREFSRQEPAGSPASQSTRRRD